MAIFVFTVELFGKGWLILSCVGEIYARFAKKMADSSQLILLLNLPFFQVTSPRGEPPIGQLSVIEFPWVNLTVFSFLGVGGP